VVEGAPPTPVGKIDRPLRKLERKHGWRMVADPAGQPSVTEWRTRGTGPGLAWLELRPRTGRTHQIRVHCAELGCPVLGDPTYGRGGAALHLHARRLALPLYPAKPPIVAEAPVPPHMRAALEACGWRAEKAMTTVKEDA
jgi:23S rRNA-/tRNA-specific pseudouridylate synthase